MKTAGANSTLIAGLVAGLCGVLGAVPARADLAGGLVPGLRLADPDGALAIVNNPAGLAGPAGYDLRLHARLTAEAKGDLAAAASTPVGPVALAAALVRRDGGDLRGSVALAWALSDHLKLGAAFHRFGTQQGIRGNQVDAGVLLRPWAWLSLAAAGQVIADAEQAGASGHQQVMAGLALRPWGGSDALSLSVEGGAARLATGSQAWLGAASLAVRLVRGLHLQVEQRRDGVQDSTAVVLRGSFGTSGVDLAAARRGDHWAGAATLRLSGDAQPGLWDRSPRAVSVALRGELSERSGHGGTHMGRLLLTLQKIGRLPAIEVVVLEAQGLSLDWAQVEELRAVVGDLRRAGKKVVFYADDLGTRGLALASACDHVWLAEAGMVSARGVGADFLSVAEALAKIGVAVQVVRYAEHKSAGEPLVSAEPSAELRASLQHAAERRWSDFAAAVQLGRDVSPAALEASLAAGAAFPSDALRAKLIDAVVPASGIDDQLRKRGWLGAGEFVQRFDPPAPRPQRWVARPGIAVMEIEGNIADHSDGVGLFGRSLGGTAMAQQIRRAGRDPGTAAVVARIASGGGSAFGSEAMRDALARVGESKPVVASMGGVAASGGYWTALGAHAMFANAGTVTGSIGILLVRPDVAELYRRLGLRTTHIGAGPHSDLYRLDRPWSAAEVQGVHRQLGKYYGLFLDLTAQRRKLPRASLDALAGGRVWFGDEAVRHGLLDRTGGLLDAIAEARKRAGLREDAEVAVRFVPEPTLTQQIQRALGLIQLQEPSWVTTLQQAVGPWLDAAAVQQLLQESRAQALIDAPIEGRGR